MPLGGIYGWCDLELLDEIAALPEVAAIHPHYRGWTREEDRQGLAERRPRSAIDRPRWSFDEHRPEPVQFAS